MEFFVWGNFEGFTLIYEENFYGGIGICVFLGFWAWVHVNALRRGDQLVFYCAFGGTYFGELLPMVCDGVGLCPNRRGGLTKDNH
jgi:hypothetical protein